MEHLRLKDRYQLAQLLVEVEKASNVTYSRIKISKGTLFEPYFNAVNMEMYCVENGIIECEGEVCSENSVLVFEPGDIIYLFADEEATIMTVQTKGTPNDCYAWWWDSYHAFDSLYSKYLHRLQEVAPCTNWVANKQTDERIEFEDITVVVQGYANETTIFTCESIRKYLPGACIILSTWPECNIDNISFDELVISEDPGAIPCEIWDDFTAKNNGNRQIVSTKAGLSKVKTKYAMKLRSDCVLLGNGFLDYFNNQPEIDNRYQLYDKRIVICELYSRHNFVYYRQGQRYDVPKPFHPSDWYAFGLTEDLRNLYDDVPIIPVEEMQYKNLIHQDYVEKYQYKYAWRYATEQHIFLSSVKKKFPNLVFRDWTDWTDENIELSENIMKNNFMILDLSRSEILNTKYTSSCFANNSCQHIIEKLFTYEDIFK